MFILLQQVFIYIFTNNSNNYLLTKYSFNKLNRSVIEDIKIYLKLLLMIQLNL